MCLSLSLGIPLLRALSFLPSPPQINYKLNALEQMLGAEPLKQTADGWHGKDNTVVFDRVTFGYEEKSVVSGVSLMVREGQKTALVGNPVRVRAHWQSC